MQYAQPLICDARTRTSSRSRGSRSAASSSLVAALSRCAIAREKAGAWVLKSRRIGIAPGCCSVVVMRRPYRPTGPEIRSTSMTDTWATSGLDLHLDVTGPRVRAGLEAALRDAVRSGRLRPGARLPSSRALAADLGIARNTVADAYGQLVAEGWLVARRGSGTSVADRAPGAQAAVAPAEADPARLRHDLRAGRARPLRVPPLGLARGRAAGAHRGAVRRARLRRPPRTPGAPRRARRLPRPRARRGRGPGPPGRLLGLHPGAGAAVPARCAPAAPGRWPSRRTATGHTARSSPPRGWTSARWPWTRSAPRSRSWATPTRRC